MLYVIVFKTYSYLNAIGYKELLLQMYLIGDDTTQNAKEYFEFHFFFCSVSDSNIISVVSLTRDTFSTNRTFSRMVGPIFVGCYCNRFYLSVMDVHEHEKKIFKKR